VFIMFYKKVQKVCDNSGSFGLPQEMYHLYVIFWYLDLASFCNCISHTSSEKNTTNQNTSFDKKQNFIISRYVAHNILYRTAMVRVLVPNNRDIVLDCRSLTVCIFYVLSSSPRLKTFSDARAEL
jgi:hypothetical protein